MTKKEIFKKIQKEGKNPTITLHDKAIKLISDLDYYEAEKDYLSEFEKDLIIYGQYLKHYNDIIKENHDRTEKDLREAYQEINKLEYESSNKQDTIEDLKDYISHLEYNLKRSNYRENLAKKLLDEQKIENKKDFYEHSLTYNDLLFEIQNKTDLIIVSIINNDKEDERTIRLYNNNENKIINEIIEEFNDFDIEIQKNVYVGHGYKTIDVLTFLLSNELIKIKDED